MPYGFSRLGSLGSDQNSIFVTRRFGSNTRNENGFDNHLSREFLAKAWVADKKTKKSRGKKRSQMIVGDGEEENGVVMSKRVLKQPPLSQSVSGFLKPEGPEEVNFCFCILYGMCFIF